MERIIVPDLSPPKKGRKSGSSTGDVEDADLFRVQKKSLDSFVSEEDDAKVHASAADPIFASGGLPPHRIYNDCLPSGGPPELGGGRLPSFRVGCRLAWIISPVGGALVGRYGGPTEWEIKRPGGPSNYFLVLR